jgi:GntR family transcriptional regulator, rspAB operon transcriptional repressor
LAILEKITLKRSPTMREEVFKHLRHKIITGEAAPGTKLNEVALAEEIGSSRTPVREALHNLEMEKLIKSVPRIGYIVREIEPEEVEEMIEIRIALETLATKWASEKISHSDLNRLENNIIQTEDSIRRKDSKRVVGLDTEFHDIICKASKSRWIEEISQTLRDHMLRFRMMGLGMAEIAQRSNEGHRRIVDAMKSRNVKKIQSAVWFHLNCTRKDLIQTIQ